MKELRCTLVLALVGLVSATPYGYGVKGGAGGAAKADAISGAVSGVSVLPLAIPSGGGFSGSYSKSASSSFSSSSASSSSGSFSFSGSGTSGLAGFGNNAISTGGCGSGACQTGPKDVTGSLPFGGSVGNGLQGYNAASAVTGAGAGSVAGVNNADFSLCSSGVCAKQTHPTTSDTYNALPGKDKAEKSEADALSASSSQLNSNNNGCVSGQCGPNVAGTASNYESNQKCTSGQCVPSSEIDIASIDNDSNGKCKSGQCASSPIAGTSTGAHTSGINKNCEAGQCGPSAPNTSNGPFESANKCASGNCGPDTQPETLATGYESSKCKSGQCSNSQNNEPSNTCTSGNCGPSGFQPALPHMNLPTDTKPSSYHVGSVGSSVHPDIPSTSYGHPVAPNFDLNSKCTHGKCGPNLLPGPSSTNYEPYDIAAIGHKSTYNSNDKGLTSDKAIGGITPVSGCFSGNCAPSTTSNTKPFTTPITYPYTEEETPSDQQSNYGYNPTTLGGSTGGYNKPVTYLTTPKQQTNYIHSTGPSTHNIPGSYSNTLHQDKPCATGNCGSNVHAYPQIPGYVTVSGLQVPAGPAASKGPNACTQGNCATYTSPSNTGYGGVNIGATAPSSSYGQSAPHFSSGLTPGYPAFPSNSGLPVGSPVGSSYPGSPHTRPQPTSSPTSNCKTPNCSPNPSPSHGVSNGVTQTVPSFVGISKPSISVSNEEDLPPYTGGFGGPSGLLKPSEYTYSSIPSSTYKPTVSPNFQNPTGDSSYNRPAIPSGTYNFAAPSTESKPTTSAVPNTPTPCATGVCGIQLSQPTQNVPTHPSGSKVPLVPSIDGSQSVSGVVAHADAEASSIAYTGGFGGPPGLLKPYDGGKLGTSSLNKYPSNALASLPQSLPSTGSSGSYGTGYNKHEVGSPATVEGISGVGAGAISQANAVAGASSGAFGGSSNYGFGGHGINTNEQKGTSGCGGGCGSNTGETYNGGNNFNLSGNLGLAKAGHIDGLSSGLSSSGAAAKSLAGAASGASGNAFGTSGSYASSAATAHASVGAGVKGGYYGRR